MRNWLFAGILMLSVSGGVAVQADESPMTAVGATQDIEYLQRWYARATDLIGTNDPSNIEEGRAIYHRIFTPDVRISASDPQAGREFAAQGPDQWVDVVAGAFCLAFAEIVTRSFYKKTQPGKYWDFLNWFKLGLCYALITDAFKLGS